MSNKKLAINLGSGDKKIQSTKEYRWINCDVAKECNPDMVVDLEKKLPFKDNSIDYIYSEHTFEHIRPEFWKQFLKELQRIAKPNCILELVLPFDNQRNRTCIDHYRTFSYGSWYINEYEAGHDGDRGYFGELRLKMISKKPNKFYRIWIQIFPFLCNEVYFKFEIVKNDETLMKKET